MTLAKKWAFWHFKNGFELKYALPNQPNAIIIADTAAAICYFCQHNDVCILIPMWKESDVDSAINSFNTFVVPFHNPRRNSGNSDWRPLPKCSQEEYDPFHWYESWLWKGIKNKPCTIGSNLDEYDSNRELWALVHVCQCRPWEMPAAAQHVLICTSLSWKGALDRVPDQSFSPTLSPHRERRGSECSLLPLCQHARVPLWRALVLISWLSVAYVTLFHIWWYGPRVSLE